MTYKSNLGPFRNRFSETIFAQKYQHEGALNWSELCDTLVEDVCRDYMCQDDKDQLKQYMREMKLIAGGRYLYYAGRKKKFFNNCYLLRSEQDTREDWADLSKRVELCLSTGGGIGNDYSVYRGRNTPLHGTGGIASGPISKMLMVNEQGRQIMQGGSRRSAIYASLNWQHADAREFIHAKDWYKMPVAGTDKTLGDLKEADFNFPCPLDMTNISLNYDTKWLVEYWSTGKVGDTFLENVKQALSTGEPGFSFNFFDKENETLRNACVPGNTKILTDKGHFPIAELVDQEVNAWNGESFAPVKPFSAGVQQLISVILSDGNSLTCTPDHIFILAGGIRARADELQMGERLEKFSMPFVEHGEEYTIDAYSQGFYSGDGNAELEHSSIYGPKLECVPRLIGKVGKHNTDYDRSGWRHGPMFDKTWVPINGSSSYCLNWFAGIIDADGTVTNDIHGNGIQLGSINKQFLLDTQLMLTRLGCRAKVVDGLEAGYRSLPNGKGGSALYKCQQAYRLLVGNTDTCNLVNKGLITNRLKLHGHPPQRDARRFVTVQAIINLGEFGETFCFTEPQTSRGTFNGIVTGQCTEVTSTDDSDVCNLASLNFAKIDNIRELIDVVSLGSQFLLCGTLVADLPYEKVRQVREKNRRLGLGLMGLHEWLVQRGYRYEVTDELHKWLQVYQSVSKDAATKLANTLGISIPVAFRAIAPTGSIGILGGTSTGIEPIFAVSYKRRYYKGTRWYYQYVVDSAGKDLIENYGVNPQDLESAIDLAIDYERRIKFQADVQDYVDMSISSTINMPSWGSKDNNEDLVMPFAATLARYSSRLRGFTCYPDGSRGGQPITSVPYAEAVAKLGEEFEEAVVTNDVCEITGRGGSCGT